MSANHKTVFNNFDYLHCDDFARFLGEMAAKGWHFKEWGIGLKFEKGEPEHAVYAVEVFTDASENDTRPEPHTKEFAEYCEAAGWKLVDARQKFCIFKKLESHAVEIFTPEARVENAYKSMRTNVLPLFIINGVNVVIQWFSTFGTIFESSIFSSIRLFNIVVWTILFFIQFGKYAHLLIWKHKMKKCLKAGEEIYLGVEKDGKKKIDWHLWFASALLIGMMIFLHASGEKEMFILNVMVLVAFVVFAFVIAKVRPESNTNFFVQIFFGFFIVFATAVIGFAMFGEDDTFSQNDAPLLVEDYREDVGVVEDITLYHDKNILGSRHSYIIYYKDNYLIYDIYISEVDWILDKIWEKQFDIKVNDICTDCTAEWEAETAFSNEIGEYYVRYEDIILILDDHEDLELTQEQINIIRNKLELR